MIHRRSRTKSRVTVVTIYTSCFDFFSVDINDLSSDLVFSDSNLLADMLTANCKVQLIKIRQLVVPKQGMIYFNIQFPHLIHRQHSFCDFYTVWINQTVREIRLTVCVKLCRKSGSRKIVIWYGTGVKIG